MRTFEGVRDELAGLRLRWLRGEPVRAEMDALAAEGVRLYNERARAVAARTGTKARPITAAALLRTCRGYR